jgi:rhodanese-related sulfurtransferase
VPRHSARWKLLERQGFRHVCGAPGANVLITHTAREGHRLPERVVYWAATGGSLKDASQLRGAERAYGEYSNMGVAMRTSHKGRDRLVFRVVSPCAYIARGRGQRTARQWCRHLHFVALERRSDATHHTPISWQVNTTNQNELFTLPVFPCSLLDKYDGRYSCVPLHKRKSKSQPPSLFVSNSEYIQATRPNTGSAVGVCAIDDRAYPPLQNHDLVINWKASESAIRRALHKSPRVSSEHTPLVVYCANPQCLAAQALIEKLAHIGYCNVWYYKEGMGV